MADPRLRIDRSSFDRSIRELAELEPEPVLLAAGEAFAAVQRRHTLVDTGELLASVGARLQGDQVVAGYGVDLPQAPAKMLARHNWERFQQALREADLEQAAESELEAQVKEAERG